MSDVNNTHLGMSHLGDVSLSLIELSEAYWLFRKHGRVKVLFKNIKTTLLRRCNLFKLLLQALNLDLVFRSFYGFILQLL